MGNPHREYVAFTRGEFWELWRCRGNKANVLGNSIDTDINKIKHRDFSKAAICDIRKTQGFTKFYGNRAEVEEYLFLLAV